MTGRRAVRSVPKLSIVLPVHNTPAVWIHEAVSSVEDARLSWAELILIDDGSTRPDTLDALAEFEARGYQVVSTENDGVSAALNRAIGLARGEYILPLNAQDLLGLGFCPVAADVLDMDPHVAVIAGVVACFETRAPLIAPAETVTLAQLLLESTVDVTSMFRKAVWAEVGGFDEDLRHGHQDAEFWIRIAARGGKIMGVDETAVWQRTGQHDPKKNTSSVFSPATSDAIIKNNEGHLAVVLRAALESADLLRTQAQAASNDTAGFRRIPVVGRALSTMKRSMARRSR